MLEGKLMFCGVQWGCELSGVSAMNEFLAAGGSGG
jgi:hypothetical protein